MGHVSAAPDPHVPPAASSDAGVDGGVKPRGPAQPQRRALVVENDLASRELLARVLRNKGMRADTAIGAAQAAGILLEAMGAIDLLVVDLNLEPVDGVELLRQLAQLPAAQRPRKIVAIAASLAEAHPRLADLRMVIETFQKPIHLPSLMTVVEEVLR